jgi:hypothetical protein
MTFLLSDFSQLCLVLPNISEYSREAGSLEEHTQVLLGLMHELRSDRD